MIALGLKLWRAVVGGREWLTLVVVAAIGAFLYVQLAETRADRDRLAAQADLICATAGEPFAASVRNNDDRTQQGGVAQRLIPADADEPARQVGEAEEDAASLVHILRRQTSRRQEAHEICVRGNKSAD